MSVKFEKETIRTRGGPDPSRFTADAGRDYAGKARDFVEEKTREFTGGERSEQFREGARGFTERTTEEYHGKHPIAHQVGEALTKGEGAGGYLQVSYSAVRTTASKSGADCCQL